VVGVHQLQTEEIHNDSTSVTFIGAYDREEPKAVKIRHGYNKDHRPDCKQIVFGLNITGDGHVPLSYQLYDGNRADVTTHVPNWEQLRELLGKEDFIYVADSKLCSYENLCTIAENGARAMVTRRASPPSRSWFSYILLAQPTHRAAGCPNRA